jgi:hypothetical protein
MTGKVFNKVDNMRAILIALLMTIASQAGSECDNLCTWGWWKTATTVDVWAELGAGVALMWFALKFRRYLGKKWGHD